MALSLLTYKLSLNKWVSQKNISEIEIVNVIETQFDIQFQTSYQSRAFLASGGIGQSQITIIVEAKSTLYFICNGKIYVAPSGGKSIAF